MNKSYYIWRIIALIILITMFWTLCAKAAEPHPILNKRNGVVYYDGHKETYYNLPMGRVCQIAKDRGIKGEYWETEDGLKMYGYFIIVAADYKTHPYGSIVLTSNGPGKVLDTGEFAKTNPEQLDLAVTW